MSDGRLRRLLGSSRPDPGCDAGFRVMDRYVEALVRGDDVARAFPELAAHLESCVACCEDVEGLLAACRRTQGNP